MQTRQRCDTVEEGRIERLRRLVTEGRYRTPTGEVLARRIIEEDLGLPRRGPGEDEETETT